MRQVDLDLFVNSASKGWNDGAKVATPFAAFLDGISKGIDQNYENELKAQQAEGQRIQNEQAPFRTDILEAQAAEAKIRSEAIQENPEAFKETIISKAQTERAAADQAAAYQSKKVKLTEIWNSGDGKAIGEAYLSRDNKDVFAKEKGLDEQFKGAFPDWAEETKQTYKAQERQLREIQTNDILLDDATKTFEKYKTDYVANPEINILVRKIQAETGAPVSATDLLEEGTMAPFRGPKQRLKRVPVLDSEGKPVMATGKDPKMQVAPAGEFGYEYESDPNVTEDETRNVFQYNGKSYQIGAGINDDTLRVFNTMQASHRRIRGLEKGTFGITDLEFMDSQKKKAQTEAVAKSQADANQTNEQIQIQREEFFKGSTVAAQKSAAQAGLIPGEKPIVEKDLVTPAQARIEEGKKVLLEGANPIVPRVLATSIAAPSRQLTPIAGVSAGSPSSEPTLMSPAQQNTLIKKQAQAAKATQFTSKYQAAPNKAVTPPVPPAIQATMTTASPYIPKNISTTLPYEPNTEAINTVASRPEMAGLSALTKAVAVQESGGVNAAKSPTGVTGIMQVTGATGRAINPDFDRTNPVHQALAGAITLSRLGEKYPNSPMLQLTAYNAGTVLTDEAVRRAGTSNWSVVKNFMEEAGNSERVQNAWYNDFINAGITPARAKKLVKTKVQEASTYAEKVIVNFPAFAFNADDNRTLQLLKQQGVFQT